MGSPAECKQDDREINASILVLTGLTEMHLQPFPLPHLLSLPMSDSGLKYGYQL